MPSVTATELKTVSVSEDGHQLNMKFATKYVGELEVILPASELDALLLAFNRSKPVPQQSAPPASSAEQPSTSQVTVVVPKTWLVTADQKRQAVIVVFNHQSDTRTGYGLNAETTQKLATALSKNADAILEQVRAEQGQGSAT